MSHGLLDQLVSIVAAAVVAASAAVGVAPEPAEKGPAKDDVLSELAEKAEASIGKGLPSGASNGAFGRDISWPNCPVGMGIPERRTLGKPMPPADSSYVIIGLTNGPAFYPNPCLAEQVAYARELRMWAAAYAVVTYPTPSQLREYGGTGPHPTTTRQGQLRNTGWAQAQQNLANMRAAGLESPIVWIDVEPVSPPAPWSDDTAANRLVVDGVIRAYRAAGLNVGVYSTTYMWQSIVGEIGYGLPEWRTAGPTTKAKALGMCTGNSIQGGEAVLGQWYNDDVDFNVLCPGPQPIDVLREYFTLP